MNSGKFHTGLIIWFVTIICLTSQAFCSEHSASDQPDSETTISSDDSSCPKQYLRPRIKDIIITGAFPVSERDIKSVLNIYPGSVMDSDLVSSQKAKIEGYLKQQGFADPSVNMITVSDPSGNHFLIKIEISRGNHYRLQNIRFSGNNEFSEFFLKTRMDSWKKSFLPGVSGRFTESSVRKDVQRFYSLYRSRGYLDVKIGYNISFAGEAHVDLEITVSEGPLFKFEWVGNNFFSENDLKKDIVFFSDGKISDTGITRSILRVKNRYKKAGFLDPKISFTEKTIPEASNHSERVFQININEGVRTRIEKISIAGNKSLPEKEIKKQIVSQSTGIFQSGEFVQQTLEEDVRAVSWLYHMKGFRNADITPSVILTQNNEQALIGFEIHEGNKTIISEISITGLHSITKEAVFSLFSMKVGNPFNEDLLQRDKDLLSELISETGRPHVQVTGKPVFSGDDLKVKIEYLVDEGPYVEMGDVIVTGNFTTLDKIFKNEMMIKTGEPFSLKKLLQSQKNISNIEIVQSVEFKSCGLKEKADNIDIVIEIEEKKPYTIDAGVGIETEKGAFFNTRIGSRNLLGANLKTWCEAEVSQIGYKAEAGFTEPRFLETRISANASLYSEDRSDFNQDFGLRILGSSFLFSTRLKNNFSAAIALNTEQREQYDNKGKRFSSYITSRFIPDEFEQRSLMMITPKIQYDSRDSFIRPRKGFFLAGYMDISKGLDNTQDNFLRYRIDFRSYITPIERLTIAGLAKWGYIEPGSREKTIFTDQLFYLGGSANVRGFDENMLRFDSAGTPVGGKSSVSGSLEARIDLGRQIELCLFVDSGRLSRYQLIDFSDEFRTSAGLGLRYITPIGAIGAVYGFKINPEPGENSGRIHLSLGYTF